MLLLWTFDVGTKIFTLYLIEESDVISIIKRGFDWCIGAIEFKII